MNRYARVLIAVPCVLVTLVTSVDRMPAARAGGGGPYSLVDRSQATRLDVVRASAKAAAICHDKGLGVTGALVLSVLASSSRPSLAVSTMLSCSLDSPVGATCADLIECSGARADLVNFPLGRCSGSTLLRMSKSPLSSAASPEAISCSAIGQSCYEGSTGAVCGTGTCQPGETYSCDGDTLVACIEGVSQRIPCGKDMTCGRTKGSRVIDCVAKGADCTGDTCSGNVLHQCVRDSFGKGSTRVVDCTPYGLVCKTEVTKTMGMLGACVAPAGGCDNGGAPTCKDGKISVCLAGKAEQVSCDDVGLAGACVAVQGSVGCQ